MVAHPKQPKRNPSNMCNMWATSLVEGGRAVSGKDLLAGSLGNAVGKRELEVLGEELLDVWAADVLGLLDLDNLEDLDFDKVVSTTRVARWKQAENVEEKLTCTLLKRER